MEGGSALAVSPKALLAEDPTALSLVCCRRWLSPAVLSSEPALNSGLAGAECGGSSHHKAQILHCWVPSRGGVGLSF